MTQLSIPESVTFQEAIALTQTLLTEIEAHQLSEEVEEALSALVSSENGARGFFVTYLTNPTDIPSPPLIRALQSSPEIVSELLVKNVAMSAAMAVTHRRNDSPEMAQSSQQVTQRSANLIQQLQLQPVAGKLKQLRVSLDTESGNYQEFLQRWGYDSEQRQAIRDALAAHGL